MKNPNDPYIRMAESPDQYCEQQLANLENAAHIPKAVALQVLRLRRAYAAFLFCEQESEEDKTALSKLEGAKGKAEEAQRLLDESRKDAKEVMVFLRGDKDESDWAKGLGEDFPPGWGKGV